MNKNLEFALAKLLVEGLTLVLYDGTEFITSKDRGIKPLLMLYENNRDYSGFCVADKVIGKAAAFMYVLLKVKEIYSVVISEEALKIFDEYGICVKCDTISDFIINRNGTDICPMEKLVLNTKSPEEAYRLIYDRLNKEA